LELGPGQDSLRPWFWVAVVFIASASRSVGWTSYEFYATRVLVHAESILTQLIYEHSLRIRLASADLDDFDEAGANIEDTTVEGGAAKAKKTDRTKDANLIGRINNLITVDLDNITQARNFLFLGQ
jgi:hypothetical protein